MFTDAWLELSTGKIIRFDGIAVMEQALTIERNNVAFNERGVDSISHDMREHLHAVLDRLIDDTNTLLLKEKYHAQECFNTYDDKFMPLHDSKG